MGSWISHLTTPPAGLVVLGMNPTELRANPMATSVLVHDLNTTPTLPFADTHFDDVVCAVSVDYLTRPLEVFAEVGRVLKPGTFRLHLQQPLLPNKGNSWLAVGHRVPTMRDRRSLL